MKSDSDRFGEAFVICATVHDKQITPELIEAYYSALSDIPIDLIEKAFAYNIQHSKFFPKPSEIREVAMPKAAEPSEMAAAQWDDVMVRLRDSRNAKSPDPVTEAVVKDLGGWIYLGQREQDKLVWIQKEFERRYVTYTETGTAVVDRQVPRLSSATKSLPYDKNDRHE
ncbi:MAG: DUF6475 domain-containing protein [Rhizobiaceae bacterium]